MSYWRSRAVKILLIGLPSATAVGYFTHQPIIAEEKVSLVKDVSNTSDLSSPRPTSFDSTTPVEKLDEIGNEKLTLIQAIRQSRLLALQTQVVNGYPGLVIGVSIKGKPCWTQGFGFANVEAGAKCNKDTVMRIASISKPLTMVVVAKLVEENKLDLDKSIYDYLGDKFPIKKVNGRKVDLTLRQIASHLGGIRHYQDHEKHKLFKTYTNSFDALEIFKDDDLLAEPGKKFNYSTFGYTVIAAVVESVLPKDQTFGDYLIYQICRRELGMMNTYLDQNTPIILNRAIPYRREKELLKNAPYVDCSYKYAGGGILSTVPDLLRFGNIMMYSFIQATPNLPGFLKKSTVETLWTPMPLGRIRLSPGLFEWCKYGLGWGLIRDAEPTCSHGACPPFKDIIFHTGSATGGTTLLMIIPEHEMVVSLICNLENARSLMSLGVQVAEIFAATTPSNANQEKPGKDLVMIK